MHDMRTLQPAVGLIVRAALGDILPANPAAHAHIYSDMYIVTSIIYIKVVFWSVQGASLSGRLPPLAAFDHKGDTKMGVKRTQRGPGLIVDAN